MNIAIDIDGTIDSFPRVFQSLMSALTAAGHHVYVITGVSEDKVTQADIDAKRQYLTSIGISDDDYFKLIICPKPHPKNKAACVTANDIALLIDNKKSTAKATKAQCAVLVLWNSKEP